MNSRKKFRKNSKAKIIQMNLRNVEAKIDNKAPMLNPENYLKSRYILSDSARLKVLDRDNLELIQRLNIVNRLGGKVDCNFIPRGELYTSKLQTEIEENRRVVMKENKNLLKGILSIEATYSTAKYLRDWKQIENNMEHTAKFPLIWKKSKNQRDDITLGADIVSHDEKKRLRCFFDIELTESKQNLGRIVFELYYDIAPVTCANFIAFCEGRKDGLSYKGTPFHRIVKKFWCQGGDVTRFNGTGGTSIYGDKFKDENFTLRHRGPGVISTWSNGPDTNNSKFNITFNSLGTMDGKRVVFGKVVHGLYNLYKIEELGCSSGKPMKKVIISNCGVIPNKES